MADRESLPGAEAPLAPLTSEQRAELEAENGIRQFDRMMQMIEAGLRGGFRLRVSTKIGRAHV